MTSENVTSPAAEGQVEVPQPNLSWRSPTIAKIAGALAVAQGQIENAAKDSLNPFFRSKYADLASVWDACRKALSDNQLSVSQHPTMAFEGQPEIVKIPTRNEGERVVVRCLMTVSLTTRLLHASGEWMESTLTSILPGADPQTVGSALTYLRRYGLAAMVGIAAEEDDDGNGANQAHDRQLDHPPTRPAVQAGQRTQRPAPPPPAPAAPAAPVTPGFTTFKGTVKKIADLPSGAIGVVLDSGVKLTAKPGPIADAMRHHFEHKTKLELVTKNPRSLDYSPLITEIEPIPDAPTPETQG